MWYRRAGGVGAGLVQGWSFAVAAAAAVVAVVIVVAYRSATHTNTVTRAVLIMRPLLCGTQLAQTCVCVRGGRCLGHQQKSTSTRMTQ